MLLPMIGGEIIFTLIMWKIQVLPRIHIFLWLLTNSKLLSRDNLAKRRKVYDNDNACMFCSEEEYISHLFFGCCVAQNLWSIISETIVLPIGGDIEFMAKFLLREKYLNV
jgi:hypothetical protein